MQQWSFGKNVWARGVTVHEMLFGKAIFGSEMDLAYVGRAILQEELVFPAPRTELHAFAYNSLSQVLDKDPYTVSLAQMKSHLYFADIDLTAIVDGTLPRHILYVMNLFRTNPTPSSYWVGCPIDFSGERDVFDNTDREMADGSLCSWSTSIPHCGSDSVVRRGADYDSLALYPICDSVPQYYPALALGLLGLVSTDVGLKEVRLYLDPQSLGISSLVTAFVHVTAYWHSITINKNNII
ncbi:hypothetical protein K488DRAFT_87830 [Vararia minispora EC-137]|uniref:Uncharacterized protein n=1 Tax=Vararia minispora EC-137 TaxID=1314806 RepID=A0ACB8QFK8_9AGAM|nr:hypothetical protein K488DRAFT_87830 [Vararia minispora EC-137]